MAGKPSIGSGRDTPMSAQPFVPASRSLARLRAAAANCEGCPLFRHATQTVFGAGSARSGLLLVGEQPGDQEDLAGQPFVGPAGRVLDEALATAGIERRETYVTNAVKHFKWLSRGKRRLHSKPSAREIAACRPWLEAEIESLAPSLIICLGATAAQALIGRQFRITRERGRIMDSDWARWIMATYHPSAVLRAPDEATRHRMRRELADDLQLAAQRVKRSRASHGGAE